MGKGRDGTGLRYVSLYHIIMYRIISNYGRSTRKTFYSYRTISAFPFLVLLTVPALVILPYLYTSVEAVTSAQSKTSLKIRTGWRKGREEGRGMESRKRNEDGRWF